MISRREKEKLAKFITVSGSLFWIVAGVWGVNTCFDTAHEMRNQQIQKIEIGQMDYARNLQAVQLATWVVPSNDTYVYQELEASGLARNPYVFHNKITQAMLISVLCIVVSFFVLYAALVLDKRRDPVWAEAKTQVTFDINER